MRIEEYIRELTGEEFIVIGSPVQRYGHHDDCRCDAIEMSLTSTIAGNGRELPIGDSLDSLLRHVEVDTPKEIDEDERPTEFMEHYAEIFCGKYRDWQLSEFRVFYGGIILCYGNPKTEDTGCLYHTRAENLRLTFKTVRSVLGFDPTYNVRIWHDSDGKHKCTEVEEDLGYMRRFITFGLKDPLKKDDGIFHKGNQIIHITEFVGM